MIASKAFKYSEAVMMPGEGSERDMPKESKMNMEKPLSGCGALKESKKQARAYDYRIVKERS